MNRIEAQQAIHDALAPIIHLMGPRTCEHGEWGGDEECECLYEDTTPVEGWALNEWTILASFMKMDDGSLFFNTESAPMQSPIHTRGLLLEGLISWI